MSYTFFIVSGLQPHQERAEAIGEQLRAKIASKFTASTFLGGFALTILSGQVFAISQSSRLSILFPLSVAAVVAAVILFFEAVVRLDELTMPKRFWPKEQDVERTDAPSDWGILTDGDLVNLEAQMRFYWHRLTIVATTVTAIAVLMMLVPPYPEVELAQNWTLAVVVLAAAVAAVYRKKTGSLASVRFPGLRRPED